MKQLTGRSEDVSDWRGISLFHNSLVELQRPAKQLWNILIPASNQPLGPELLIPVTSRLHLPPRNNAARTTAAVDNSVVSSPLPSRRVPRSSGGGVYFQSPRPLADIAYPSLNELIKGAASEVLLHFVYLCTTEALQITQTKGLS